MEIQKQCKQQQQEEFALASVTELASSSTSSSRSDSKSAPVIARFSAGNGVAVLRFNRDSESTDSISVDVKTARVSQCFFLVLLKQLLFWKPLLLPVGRSNKGVYN